MVDSTLYTVKEKIKEFANKHANINQFESDDFSKFSANNNLYPLLWVVPDRIKYKTGEILITMKIMLIDIQYDQTDMIKTISDSVITVGDLLAYLADYQDLNYYVETDSDFQPLEDRLVDNVAGIQGSIIVHIPYSVNSNTIPII